MNNDNNMNGTVLGSTDNNPVNPQPIPPVNNGMNTETLGSVNPAPAVSPVAPEPVSNPMPVPPANESGITNNPPMPDGLGPVPQPETIPNNIPESLAPQVGNVNVPPVPPMNDNPNGLPPIPPVEPAIQNNNVTQPAGFTNPNVIGITPPVSFEPEKEPKKKQNKLMFVIIVLVVLVGVGFGTYYVLNYTNIFNKATARIAINTNDLEVEIGESLSTNISDYAQISGTDNRNCGLDTKDVNLNKVGEYTYRVYCGETSKTGKIKVVDNSELVVNTNVVYKTKGETLDPKEFAKEGSDLTFELVDADATKKILDDGELGVHEIDLKVTDSNNKSTQVKGTLYVLEHKLKGFLTCSANSQNVSDLSATKVVSEKFAIVDNNGNAYGNIAYEIITYTFTDEEKFNELLESYSKDKKIKIENVEAEQNNVEFINEDDEKKIIITIERENSDVLQEYGETNMVSYSTIKDYFVNELHYTWTYENK